MKALIITLAIVLFPIVGVGQSISPSASAYDSAKKDENAATLTIKSDLPGVRVFLDTTMLGVAPFENVKVAEGTHIFRFVHPRNRSWQVTAVLETISVRPLEHVERRVHFPLPHDLSSEPYGAEVSFHDSVLGLTPLTFSGSATNDRVKFSKAGFEDILMPLSSENGEIHVLMIPLQTMPADRPSPFLRYDQVKNPLPIYLTTGATVLSGVAAAYFKIKADGYYNEYRQTNDPGKLDQVHRFDAASGISLAASQIGVLLLTYFLLSR